MKERPILFQGDMVRAILEGRKTQTRRIVKGVPHDAIHGVMDKNCTVQFVHTISQVSGFQEYTGELIKCPYGKPGDRLWVRETWGHDEALCAGVQYKADWSVGEIERAQHTEWKWKPSIHMFRKDSRILLEVTNIRVERLAHIKPVDAECEGITGKTLASPVRGLPYEEYSNGDGLVYADPISAFEALWESLNGVGSWAENPWVWVVEFKRLTNGG